MTGPARHHDGPRLEVPGNATPEEVAAVTAAVSALISRRGGAAAPDSSTDRLDHWVDASRLPVRRSTLIRGNWRLSGRLGRRSRT
ncbi:MAG: acyl-CoA carboxylase subunit epsilon [Actinobacteria bacterium]|nr:acyl-CoA carboxylase subunit epsilon [Actinomycetota bacterium]MCB9390425.1 acyl-CoA carboxylase subunit epsilon [Acidimicrobiia bacterium]